MAILQNIQWDLVAIYSFCLVNFALAISCLVKLKRVRSSNHFLRQRITELDDEVKSLHNTQGNMGEHIKRIKQHFRILKEQQEQLSLKEPSQQSYRNAIHQIRNGDSTEKIVETSGLSKGEVELLRLLNAKQSANQAVMEE